MSAVSQPHDFTADKRDDWNVSHGCLSHARLNAVWSTLA